MSGIVGYTGPEVDVAPEAEQEGEEAEAVVDREFIKHRAAKMS